jgi:hypothetical protein
MLNFRDEDTAVLDAAAGPGAPRVDGTWTSTDGGTLTLASGQAMSETGWQVSGTTDQGSVDGWTVGNAVALAIFSGGSVQTVIGSFSVGAPFAMTVSTASQIAGIPPGSPTGGTTTYTRN